MTEAGMPQLTVTQICASFSISPSLLRMARKVHRLACPELWRMVESDEVSINLALQICRTHHDGQRLILAELPGLKPRERTAFVRGVFKFAEVEVA